MKGILNIMKGVSNLETAPTYSAKNSRNEPAPPGFITAFRFADGQALRLSWDEARESIVGEGPTWLLSANDDTVEGWLEGITSMPDVAREFLNGEDKRPRVHTGPNYMYSVVADLELVAKTSDATATGALRFYVDRNRMITVRARPLQSTDRLRHAGARRHHRDTVDLFAGLIRALNDTFADLIDEIGDCLDDVEENVLEDSHTKCRAVLGDVRRRLVEIDSERNALSQLVLRKLEWAEPRSMEVLVQAIQLLNGLGAGLEGLYERAKLLQDEIAAALSEDINRKLLWLAIMSALLLPATLVMGIFGINVTGLPGTKDPASFWVVVGVMAAHPAITIFLLRKLRL
ncbi:Magnesium and cobalt transport protein CorA [Candidatus Burkholderia pumila]|uniref:Magnesium and cobalt transport protein CorA n=1 Tax=Candidatus Burkholderia pumila TaxID=1090375 RepID=A0ABR5HKE3_9BURK|nr:Magnesium and cobalt transport protein CorA [Candidatus Burkholderia pumila]